MKRTDLAYVAGIIDGEGYIGLYNAVNGNFRLQVGVTNTNEWLIQWLKFAFGGHIHQLHIRHPNSKVSYEWRVFGRQALGFLTLVCPYLKIKRPQATIAINYQKAKRHYAHITEEERAIADAQRIIMAKLNNKGG